MIKMIVFDLDGTLLNSKGNVSKETISYLNKLKNNGYIIVSASGRILSSQKAVAKDLSFVNYVITGAGSECYDLVNDKTIFEHRINLEIAKKITKYYNENCKYIDICNKNVIYSYTDILKPESFIKCTKDWDYIFENVGSIYHMSISMFTDKKIATIKKKLEEDMPELDINIMQDSFSNKKWIEIISKECTKYNAIKKLANHLNIDNDEIIAFGDGLNDIDMLKKCGVGVAMNNALTEVKENADHITDFDYNNDGIIRFLNNFFEHIEKENEYE